MRNSQNKFGAIKSQSFDGLTFHSRKEARRYTELKFMQQSKNISDLELQPKFELIVNGVKIGTYIGDFRYIENGETIIEDVKGMRTPYYVLKRKLMLALYGIKILET